MLNLRHGRAHRAGQLMRVRALASVCFTAVSHWHPVELR